MQTVKTKSETINISREKLLSLVSRNFGGTGDNPNPDEPHKPGPWDPIIRKVAKQFFAPQPEPWNSAFIHPVPWVSSRNLSRTVLEFFAHLHPEIWDAIGGGHFFSRAAAELNPQPLPPRAAFLAAFVQEVIDRASLMQEIADTLNQTGEDRGIIIVSGYLGRLVDDGLCPEPIKIKIPLPKPKGGEDRFTALELLTAAAVFEENAASVANESFRQELRNAGAKLIETGIDRI